MSDHVIIPSLKKNCTFQNFKQSLYYVDNKIIIEFYLGTHMNCFAQYIIASE